MLIFLRDNWYLIVAALVSGGMLLWPLIRRGAGGTTVSPLEAVQLMNHRNAIVVDVRDEKAFARGSLTGARNVPAAALASRVSELARFKARPAIVVCESGQASARALATLKTAGFDEVRSLQGGLAAWKQAGLPLVGAVRETARSPKDGGNAAPGDIRPNSRRNGRQRNKGQGPAPAVAASPAAGLNGSAVIDEAVATTDAPAAEPRVADRVK